MEASYCGVGGLKLFKAGLHEQLLLFRAVPPNWERSRQSAASWSYLEVYLILVIKFHPWGDLKRTGKGMCYVLRGSTPC